MISDHGPGEEREMPPRTYRSFTIRVLTLDEKERGGAKTGLLVLSRELDAEEVGVVVVVGHRVKREITELFRAESGGFVLGISGGRETFIAHGRDERSTSEAISGLLGEHGTEERLQAVEHDQMFGIP